MVLAGPGSRRNVDGSGRASMSDSSNRANPSTADPSKPMPSRNAFSSSSTGMAKDFRNPRTSVNHRRTNRTPSSSASARVRSAAGSPMAGWYRRAGRRKRGGSRFGARERGAGGGASASNLSSQPAHPGGTYMPRSMLRRVLAALFAMSLAFAGGASLVLAASRQRPRWGRHDAPRPQEEELQEQEDQEGPEAVPQEEGRRQQRRRRWWRERQRRRQRWRWRRRGDAPPPRPDRLHRPVRHAVAARVPRDDRGGHRTSRRIDGETALRRGRSGPTRPYTANAAAGDPGGQPVPRHASPTATATACSPTRWTREGNTSGLTGLLRSARLRGRDDRPPRHRALDRLPRPPRPERRQGPQAPSSSGRPTQPWSNGRVGMTGHSYVGSTPARRGAAPEAPEGLVTIVPSAGLASMYDHQFNKGVPWQPAVGRARWSPTRAWPWTATSRRAPRRSPS